MTENNNNDEKDRRYVSVPAILFTIIVMAVAILILSNILAADAMGINLSLATMYQ